MEYNLYARDRENDIAAPNINIINHYRTTIVASFGIGMGASYLIANDVKLDVNFTAQTVSNINRYIRLMAGVSYII